MGEQLTISCPERAPQSFWGKKHNREYLVKILQSGSLKIFFQLLSLVLKCAKGTDKHSFCKAACSSPALYLLYPVHGEFVTSNNRKPSRSQFPRSGQARCGASARKIQNFFEDVTSQVPQKDVVSLSSILPVQPLIATDSCYN